MTAEQTEMHIWGKPFNHSCRCVISKEFRNFFQEVWHMNINSVHWYLEVICGSAVVFIRQFVHVFRDGLEIQGFPHPTGQLLLPAV